MRNSGAPKKVADGDHQLQVEAIALAGAIVTTHQ
jgi:hypothetical protein